MALYLVAGAAGFIGSRVSAMLLGQGNAVIGVDNLNDAYDVRLKRWRLDRLAANPSFAFHCLDVCDRQALGSLVAGTPYPFSAVINLAARAGVRPSVSDPWGYVEVNVQGTLNLLDLCRGYSIPKFVLASSSSVYGAGEELPFSEKAPADRPLSPYAASKRAAEMLSYSYHYLHSLDVTIFRYFTVYGPAGRPDMMPLRMVHWISSGLPVTVYGDGRQLRDYTYIDDIARGTIAGLRMVGYEVVNLGSDKPVALLDALRIAEELIGQPAHLDYKHGHPADVPATWADIRKAKLLLGWRPSTCFEDGMRSLVEWYQQNRDWVACVL